MTIEGIICSTVDGDRSHKIKICLLLGRKAMINLDSRLKNRDITLMTKIHRVKGVVFPVFMYRCESQTTKKKEGWGAEKLILSNGDAGEDSWESLGQQGDQNSHSYRKSTLNFRWKDWYWSSNILATWWEELTCWKRLWCWERLKAGGEVGDRGWDGWMTSLTHWTWVSAVSSR